MNRTGFRLGWSLFVHKWWMQAIIMILLAVTLIMVNVLTCIVWDAFGAERLLRRFDEKDDTAFFMPLDAQMTDGVWEELEHATYEPVSFKFSDDQKGRAFTLMLYGERTAAGLGVPVKSVEGDRIPCIAAAPYRVGDVIETWYYDRVATLEVVEELKTGDPYLSFSNIGSNPTMETLCDKVSTEGRSVVLACRERMPRVTQTRAEYNAVVFFEEDSRADKARLQKAGWLVSLATVEKESGEEVRTYLATYLPISLATFLIGIVSLIGMMMMTLVRQTRTFAILHICGMSRRQLGHIGRCYGLLLAAGAAVLAAVGWVFVFSAAADGSPMGWPNGVATLFLLTLPVALADWLPRRMIPREDSLTALSKTEAMI